MDPSSLASLLPLALTAGLVCAVLVAVSFATSRETQRARADRLTEELEKLRRAARPTRDGGLSTDITASRLAVVGAAQDPEPEREPGPEAPEGEATTALLEEIARRLAALSSDVRSATFPPPLAGPSPWEAAADRLLAIAEALEPPEAPVPERTEPEPQKEGPLSPTAAPKDAALTAAAALGSVASALTRAAGAEARLREASQVAERQQERAVTALTEAGEGAQRADRAADALAPFGAQVAGFADRLNLLSLSLPGSSGPQPGPAGAAGVDELHALFDELRRAARDIASGARRVAQAARETREATDAALATVATVNAGAEAAERLEAAHADAARALAEAQDALRVEEARRRGLEERLQRAAVREDAVRSLL
ncbi:MAG: hypothetical protein JNK60_05670, partial [Acidobacteria bacterium]|nr:hypothetical protein [Acidobacteriota bacterium]